jgi:hypothetical protein
VELARGLDAREDAHGSVPVALFYWSARTACHAPGEPPLDESIRDLERAAVASPEDAAAHARLARALERSGEPLRAVESFARAVEFAPSDADALRDLDRLTRGGVDPRSPWPCERGDGWRTGRSRCEGPKKGAIEERQSVHADLHGIRGFAVDRQSRVVLCAGRRLAPLTPELLEDVFRLEERDRSVWSGTRELPAQHKIPEAPALLPCGFVVSGSRSVPLAKFSVERETAPPLFGGERWVAGLGHLLTTAGRQGITAHSLRHPLASRWKAAVPHPPARLALAPGAQLVVLTEGGLGARGSLHRFDIASGKTLASIALERVGIKAGVDLANVIASEDGVLYLGLGGSVAALAPDGKLLFRHEHPGEPVALAGERSEVLLVSEPRTLAPVALDRFTGKELWRSRDACLNGLPKVDARGIVYWRREQELVALAPLTGETLLAALVGEHSWEFAFAGDSRAYALRRAVRGSPAELVIIE